MIVATAEDAAALLAPLLDAREGRVAVLHLDADRRLIDIVEPDDAADIAGLPVRAIVADALRLGAQAIVVGSVHADGDPAPGEADRAGARALADSARHVGIRLLDHLIFTGSDVRSFRELGLL
jgi:DNA repair protein RadC